MRLIKCQPILMDLRHSNRQKVKTLKTSKHVRSISSSEHEQEREKKRKLQLIFYLRNKLDAPIHIQFINDR